MKYKVIATIIDGVIAANKNNIVCFAENSLSDSDGDRLENIYPGLILEEKNHRNADRYWSYTKKEWQRINKEFCEIKI